MSDESCKESMHLQLQSIQGAVVAISNDAITVREYYVSDIIIVASTNSKEVVTIFKDYIIQGKNIDDLQYREVKYERSDSNVQERYLSIYKDGKFLSKCKSFAGEWKSIEERKKPNALEMLANNTKRIKEIIGDLNAPIVMKSFLESQGNNIKDKHYETFAYPSNAADIDEAAILSTVKDFCLWFRDQFPYYHDKCFACSNKGKYLGTIYPTSEELGYLASRCELYHCESCGAMSKFTRFNDVTKVLETRRGRCGEYSVMILLFLQLLGYETRWVVDRDDHVWAEIKVPGSGSNEQTGRWVHVDPCEAAVDEPLIYVGWGKKPTFVFAFTADNVEDVTNSYVPDSDEDREAMRKRRLEEGVTEELLAQKLEEARSSLRRT